MSTITEKSPLILDQAREVLDAIHVPEYTDNDHLTTHKGVTGDPEGVSETDTLYESVTDTRITSRSSLLTPAMIEHHLPLSRMAMQTTLRGRQEAGNILTGNDDRLMVIVGPCSIHDPEAALEYAAGLAEKQNEYKKDLCIVMRTYFEKPRTVTGWKGLFSDPELNETYNTNLGLVVARMILLRITELGVATATERLDTGTPQYINGLITLDAIGARNAADQNARAYASGSSSPVGIKNSPEGSIRLAIDGVEAANAPHHFIGIDRYGRPIRIQSTGNPLAHIILRGGKNGPNYSAEHVQEAVELLRARRLLEAIQIDASHDNSRKNHTNQVAVVRDVATQVAHGQTAIKGVMIESNLMAGKQTLNPSAPHDLEYGVSITDACVGLPETFGMLKILACAVRDRRQIA